MRVSREQAEKNHQAVINMASRLFREHGFNGIGLKDLMKGVGLTQGGFYKQFESKEDLAAQASKRAMEMATNRWSKAAARHPDAPLEAVIDFYLSPGHRAEKRDGCPLVALGSDAMRQGSKVKSTFEDGVKAHLQLLGNMIPSTELGAKQEGALSTLALMVGALTLARLVNDQNLSQSFLDAAAGQVRNITKAL